MQNFGFPDDPIVTGFFMDSGTAFGLSSTVILDHSGSNFTFVASHLGCSGLDAPSELECMRNVPAADIINFMGQYQDNSTDVAPNQPPIQFTPVADDRWVFSNYTERYVQGAYAKLPAIYSTCANEFSSLTYAFGWPYSPTIERFPADQQAIINNATLGYFLCRAALSSELRQRGNVTSYRYLYGGNFTNVSPLPYLGATHASDLPLLFGSFQDFNGQGPSFEYTTSAVMQDFLLAFMKDPQNGPGRMGWPDAASGQMLLLGADGWAAQNVSISQVDAACTGEGTYNAYP